MKAEKTVTYKGATYLVTLTREPEETSCDVRLTPCGIGVVGIVNGMWNEAMGLDLSAFTPTGEKVEISFGLYDVLSDACDELGELLETEADEAVTS